MVPVVMTLVASVRPPIPVSRVTMSQSFSRKYRKARAVSISNTVGPARPSAFMDSAAAAMAVTWRARASFSMYASSTWMRSRYENSVGEM